MYLTPAIVNCSSFETADGSIYVSVFGDAGVPTFAWSTGATTQTITGLVAGEYSVIVYLAGQRADGTYTVTQPTVWDLEARPYDVSLLSDIFCRDLYSRQVACRNTQYTAKDGTLQAAVHSSNGTDGGGNLNFVTYSSDGSGHDVLQMDAQGVTVSGNLKVSGNMTQIDVADINVIDKTITLCAGTTETADLDGAGMVLGEGETTSRSLLYNAAHDALVTNTALFSQGSALSIRVGSDWNSAALLGANSFSVFNAAGKGIRLDEEGLVITGAALDDLVDTGTYSLAYQGLRYNANYSIFGYSDTYNSWQTYEPINALRFDSGTTSLSSNGFQSGDTLLTSLGLRTANMSLDSLGIDLHSDHCIYFGSQMWRLSYDNVENALNFQKKVYLNGEWIWITKLSLD